jgi:hypothetical protein
MIVGETVKDIDIDMPRDSYDTGKYMPTFNAYLTAIVRDSKGKVINIHRQRSHSPTANFIYLLLPYNSNSPFTLTNISGGTCTYQPRLTGTTLDITYPNTNGGAAPPGYLAMIQAGSGQLSNPFSATSLAAPIANGSGAGQLVYGSIVSASGIGASGSSAYFQISQTYTNLTSSAITITEVGIVAQVNLCFAVSINTKNCGQILVWYDVLSSPISVPSGGSITIYYTFTVNP